MSHKKDIRVRVYFVFTMMCVFGLLILAKAVWIQIKEGDKLRALAVEMRTNNTVISAERGNIYSESGEMLCSTIPQFDVRVDYSVINPDTFQRHIDSLASAIANLFKDASAETYKQKMFAAFKGHEKYSLLKNNLRYYQYQTLRTFPIFNKGKARGGLIVESKTKRINPYKMLAYRTIGLYRENAQTIGLESTFDSVLHGINGRRLDQKLTGGVWMPVEGSEIEPKNGRDIVTTLDLNIQEVAEYALMSVLKQYECQYGTVIVMEVSTGKIRALVNLGRQKDGSYWEDLNYAMFPTEPGSTFKMATLISLLSDGYINVDNMVNCEGGQKQFANRVMHDSHHGLGVMPIREAFAHSSNVGMASLAQKYYGTQPQKFVDHLKRLHLTDRTGIDLAGERRPAVILPGTNLWSATTLPWMATGYGVLVAPLHTCMLYNAVANSGKMMRPYLVSAIREYGKDVKVIKPQVLVEKIAPDEAIPQLKACAEEVVLSGTGKHIQSPYYTIAGKTGTAQVADKGIGYKDRVYQGSFVGYFPTDKPKYTIAVVIRTKANSGAYYGGTVAAPVFRMISDKIFASGMGKWSEPLDSIARKEKVGIVAQYASSGENYLKMLQSLNQKVVIETPVRQIAQLNVDTNKRLSIKPNNVFHGQVPDVKGLSLKDAIYILENEGLKVSIQGKGLVNQQSLTPGQKITKGQIIILHLS